MSDLGDLREHNRRRSKAYVRIVRVKIGPRWHEEGMRKWEVIVLRALSWLINLLIQAEWGAWKETPLVPSKNDLTCARFCSCESSMLITMLGIRTNSERQMFECIS